MFASDASLVINEGEPAVGHKAIHAVASEFMTAFPDLLVTCERFEATGHAYKWSWRMRGTYSGPGGTNRSIDIRGHEVITFDLSGGIATAEGFFDQADYDRQLELVEGTDHDEVR
jgi:hypothetical protein